VDGVPVDVDIVILKIIPDLEQGSLTKGEGLSTLDLLVLTCLDQLLLMLKILFTFLQNKLP
jgi:hypothetical protein